jgi:hypothetical protein
LDTYHYKFRFWRYTITIHDIGKVPLQFHISLKYTTTYLFDAFITISRPNSPSLLPPRVENGQKRSIGGQIIFSFTLFFQKRNRYDIVRNEKGIDIPVNSETKLFDQKYIDNDRKLWKRYLKYNKHTNMHAQHDNRYID